MSNIKPVTQHTDYVPELLQSADFKSRITLLTSKSTSASTNLIAQLLTTVLVEFTMPSPSLWSGPHFIHQSKGQKQNQRGKKIGEESAHFLAY